MDAVPSSPSAPPAPGSGSSAILTAWPRSAQLTTAFLLGVTVTLVAIHTLGYSSWGARPVELEHRLDLNDARREELLQLPRVGAKMADRIVDARRGQPFDSVDDLRRVQGVGSATLERLRPLVRAENGEGPPAPTTGKKKTPSQDRPIDINRATAEQLASLPGIGVKRAAAIITERGKGRFKSVDDLHRVSGIGKVTLEKLRPYVVVDNELRLAASEGQP